MLNSLIRMVIKKKFHHARVLVCLDYYCIYRHSWRM